MKKFLFLMIVLSLSVFGQLRTVDQYPPANGIFAKDYFMLTQDTTITGDQYRTRKISFDSLMAFLGYSRSVDAGSFGNYYISESARIDSVFNTVSRFIVTRDGRRVYTRDEFPLWTTDTKSYVKFSDIAGNGEIPFVAGDILIGGTYRSDGSIERMNVIVGSVDGLRAVLLYNFDLGFGQIEPGDQFVRIGNTSNYSRQQAIHMVVRGDDAPFIALTDSIDSFDKIDSLYTTHARVILGNLDIVPQGDFGEKPTGYGLASENVYLTGDMHIISGKTRDEIDSLSVVIEDTDSLSYINRVDIDINASGISANVSSISVNSGNISNNSSNISVNAGNISTNTTNISSNNAYIDEIADTTVIHRTEINQNTSGIQQNVESITTVEDTTTVLRTDLNLTDSEIVLRTSQDAATKSSVTVSSINGGSVVIEGKNITLDGNTTVNGTSFLNGNVLVDGSINISNPTTAFSGGKLDGSDINNDLGWVTSATAGIQTYTQASPPTGNPGDIWIDTDDQNKFYIWNGSAWIDYIGYQVAWGTFINSSGVYTGTLTAAQVNAVAIDAGSIETGTLKSGVITADSIITGTLDGNLANITNINASEINTGTLDAGVVDVANINALNINTGTLRSSVITADSLTTGTLDASTVTVSNLDADNITTGTFTAGTAKFGNDVSGSSDGLYMNSNNFWFDNGAINIGGSAGISYGGTGQVQIGTDVDITGDLDITGNLTTSDGAIFGTDVSSTNDGIYLNSNNFWYQTGAFQLGGSNGISYSGSGNINFGSTINADSLSVISSTLGTITNPTTFTDDVGIPDLYITRLFAQGNEIIDSNLDIRAYSNFKAYQSIASSYYGIFSANGAGGFLMGGNDATGNYTNLTGSRSTITMQPTSGVTVNSGFLNVIGDLNISASTVITSGRAIQNVTTITASGNIESSSGSVYATNGLHTGATNVLRISAGGALSNITSIDATGDIDTSGDYQKSGTTGYITSAWGTKTLYGYIAPTSGAAATTPVYTRTLIINGVTVQVIVID